MTYLMETFLVEASLIWGKEAYCPRDVYLPHMGWCGAVGELYMLA